MQTPIAFWFNNGSLAAALGWTLLHFLWQAALVAVGLKLLLLGLRGSAPQARYLASCSALAILVLLPLGTFAVIRSAESGALHAGANLAPELTVRRLESPTVVIQAAVRPHGIRFPVQERLQSLLPWVVRAWALGVLLCAIRLTAGWWGLCGLAKSGMALSDPEWEQRLSRVAQALQLRYPVRLLQSTLVQVPAAMGWLRPLVLLPTGMLTGLSLGQVDAILAHELAHVRRRDFLVNLVQSLIEALLFYHPAVWWVSAQIRREREHCCDDLAVLVCGDPLGYARALATLEEQRAAYAQLALAASDGPLLGRVRRLVQGRTQAQPVSGAVASALLLVTMAGLLVAARAAAPETAPVTVPLPLAAQTGVSEAAALVVQPRPDANRNSSTRTNSGSTNLFTRSYKVDPKAFLEGIRAGLPMQAQPALLAPLAFDTSQTPAERRPLELVRDYLRRAGVDFAVLGASSEVSNRKALFYNSETGQLLARATLQELDQIDRAIDEANHPFAQVVIEVKFVEADLAKVRSLPLRPASGTNLSVQVTNTIFNSVSQSPDLPAGTAQPSQVSRRQEVTSSTLGLLTSAQMRAALRTFEQTSGTDVLAAPRVTTLSGQQAQIQMVELKNILIPVVNDKTGQFTTNAVPFGPTVDLVPYLLADGRTIDLVVIPSLTEFQGYGDPGAFIPSGSSTPERAVLPLPRFSSRTTLLRAAVPDGETLVLLSLGKPKEQDGNKPARQLLVFVTPTIIDAAGNRVHPE